MRPYLYDEFRTISKEEGRAVDGIIELLPDDFIDWDYEWVDSLDDALRVLVRHLSNIKKEEVK
jgi:hypothetical protein